MKSFLLQLTRPTNRVRGSNLRFFSTFDVSKKICYYEILGVPRNAATEDIRRKFFEMAKIHHPDISSDPESNQIFQNLSEAYGILSNLDLRAQYDRLKGYDKLTKDTQNVDDSQPLTEEEIFKNLYKKYKSEKELKDTEQFNTYFKEKYINKTWDLKDPMHPLNFYNEMYDQKVAEDKIAAEVS